MKRSAALASPRDYYRPHWSPPGSCAAPTPHAQPTRVRASWPTEVSRRRGHADHEKPRRSRSERLVVEARPRARTGRRTMRLDYRTALPATLEGMRALQHAVHQSTLDPALLELVKTRASQINGCACCPSFSGEEIAA